MKRNADRPNSTPVPPSSATLLPLELHADLELRRQQLARWAEGASLVELDVVLRLTERLDPAEADVVAFPSVRA